MILLEELKSKVDLLSVGMLKACNNVPHYSDIATLTLSKNTKAAIIKVIFYNHHSHLLYSDKRLTTLLDYLEESFKLSEIQSVTYYITSKKIVFTFDKNRIFLDPEESFIELSNFTKGIKRKLPRNSIRVQLDLIELLFKDTVNSLSKRKTDTTETYKTSNSFRSMVESVNNVVSLNRNYTGRVRDIPLYNNRAWGPRYEYSHPQVQEDYVLDTPANRAMIHQRELVERYNLADLEGIQNVPRYLNVQADTDTPMSRQSLRESIQDARIFIDDHDYTATTMDREYSVNTERLNHLEELLRATEDADATATAIQFAENYLSN